MKKVSLVFLSATLFVSVLFAGSASTVAAKESKILEFDTMIGVPSTLTGTQASIAFRGVNGGGLAWALTSAKGELKASGKLELEVKGLVFAAGPNTGSNTIANFRVLVSCIRSDGTVQNVLTDPFPATTGAASAGGGNAEVETMVAIPRPCFAPMVFITSPGGAWFAVTGN